MRLELPNLSRSEVEQHTKWLCQWRRPCETLSYVGRIVETVGDAALFNRGNLGFLRDAWAAGTFGRIRRAHRVRLARPDPPDFEMKFARGRARPFEFKEAILPGRPRGKEYLEKEMRRIAGQSTLEHDPIEQWEKRRQQIPAALRDAVRTTLRKSYAPGTGLLIYLNIETFGLRRVETEATFTDAISALRDKFEQIWILWGAAYCVWPRWRKLTRASSNDEL